MTGKEPTAEEKAKAAVSGDQPIPGGGLAVATEANANTILVTNEADLATIDAASLTVLHDNFRLRWQGKIGAELAAEFG